MGFTVATDENIFRTFWSDEKLNSPRWFNDASETWTCSWDAFKAFCDRCTVYDIDGKALLYVERVGDNAEIHFSLIRGEEISIADLLRVRDEIFKDHQMIWGWIGEHNRGLRRIAEACGLKFTGFRMFHGFSHGKLLKWMCFSLTRQEYFALSDKQVVVNLA